MNFNSFVIKTFMVLCVLWLNFIPAFSQEEQKITLKFNSLPLSDAISLIEKSTAFTFFYDPGKTDLRKKVSLNAEDLPISKAMSSMLAGSGLDFEVRGRQIALLPAAVTENIIKGTVTDGRSLPIAGVAVYTEGDSHGVVTDSRGNFNIRIARVPATLVFSCLGFETTQVAVAVGQSEVNVKMEESSIIVDDVVVVGYGTQKKVNLTGAVSTIGEAQLKDRTGYSVGHMLQGSIPGLTVTTPSGMPGNKSSINIRGVNSINSGKPLVLIDGVEGELHTVNPNDIESVTVLKDASSSAIYGARASFGVVLITTKNGARSGDEGQPVKANVSYSGRWGFGRPTVSTDYETRGYYSVYLNDLFMKSYSGTPYTKYTETDYDELWARRNDKKEHPDRPWVMIDQRSGRDTYVYYANFDWYHHLYNDTRPMSNQDVSISGGTGRSHYYLSAGYYNEDGIVRQHTDNYKKYNFRSKVGFDINKWFSITNNTTYFKNKYKYPGPSPLSNFFSLDKVHALASFVPVNPDGTSVYQTAFMDYTIMDGLPAIQNKGRHYNSDFTDNISTTTELTYQPVKGLTFTANYTYMFNSSRYSNRGVNVDYSLYPGETNTLTTGRFEDKLIENISTHVYNSANFYGTYDASFGQHNIKVTAGYNWETKWLKDVKGTGYNLLSETLHDLALVGQNAAGERITDVSGGYNEYAIMGVFGRFNYDYRGKYLFEASGRYDGTSRFKRGQRWGFFPSFSAGWRISEEEFFEPVQRTVDNLKLRVSYGTLGNQQVGYYDYLQTVTISKQGNYLFGGDKSALATISAPVASDFTWEKTEHTNLGLDVGMLRNRLNFTTDLYIRDTKNMLTAGKTLPASYGASSPKTNSADLRTKGYELTLTWRDSFKLLERPFHYNASFIFSDYTTKITKFDNPEKSLSQSYYEGMRIGEIWGYRVDGYFHSDEEARNWHIDQSSVNAIINSSAGEENGIRAGDLKFVDLDGDNVINKGQNRVGDSGDYQIIGNKQPRYHYGFNLGFDWAGIDFSVFLQGVGKQQWYPGANSMLFWGPYARPYSTYIPKNFHTDIWSEDNPNAYYPRPRGYVALQGDNRELTAVNDKYLQNIGYCRLKNLTVGYTLPARWTKKILIDNVRIYFSGENLATWTGLRSDYIDPEQAMADDLARTYPYQKSYVFGIDIRF